MRTFLPSKLDLKRIEKCIQLQFTGLGFELCLYDRGALAMGPLAVAASQLRQVSLDMRAVEVPPLRFVFENRQVVLLWKDRVWARVPDVTFMRLLDLAIQGSGNSIELTTKEKD